MYNSHAVVKKIKMLLIKHDILNLEIVLQTDKLGDRFLNKLQHCTVSDNMCWQPTLRGIFSHTPLGMSVNVMCEILLMELDSLTEGFGKMRAMKLTMYDLPAVQLLQMGSM